jgi:hypothetical protein
MVPSILIGALRRTAWLCVPASLLLTMPSPGHAQSFFETLFGGPKKPAAAANFSAPPQRLAPLGYASAQPVVGGSINRATTAAQAANSSRSRRDEDEDERSHGGKGGLRTVCVRLCDGYYWPVSHGVSRSQFRKDARTCEASCNGDAKLFHLPVNSEIGEAVDQSGKPYGRLPVAFLYRKKLVAGCACRPEAWSDAEVSRHQGYAFNEAQEKARKAEAEAAEEARLAAAEAAKAEAEQRLAEAKLLGKNGVKLQKGAAPTARLAKAAPGAVAAVEPATSGDDAIVGSATVASATLAPAPVVAPKQPDVVLTEAPAEVAAASTPRKTRARHSRDGVNPANPANPAVAAGVRPPRGQQPNVRPQPTYASASPPSSSAFGGLFAKKHNWPGD